MAEVQKYQPRPLVKIEELYTDLESIAKSNELNRLLNCNPKPEWIQKNKFAGNSDYIPIGIIEYLLTSIFIKWRVEVKSIHVIANSVVVSVRLHYLDPVTAEWEWQDGIGASPIQTKSGAAATDFSQVNTSAVQMAAPAAETYAVKDAAEKLGKLFGKDLNRNMGSMDYTQTLGTKFKDVAEIPEELKVVISATTEKSKLFDEIYKNNPEYHSNPQFMRLLNQRKTELSNGVTADTGK